MGDLFANRLVIRINQIVQSDQCYLILYTFKHLIFNIFIIFFNYLFSYFNINLEIRDQNLFGQTKQNNIILVNLIKQVNEEFVNWTGLKYYDQKVY